MKKLLFLVLFAFSLCAMGNDPSQQKQLFSTSFCSSGETGSIVLMKESVIRNSNIIYVSTIHSQRPMLHISFYVTPEVAKKAGFSIGKSICLEDVVNTPKVSE